MKSNSRKKSHARRAPAPAVEPFPNEEGRGPYLRNASKLVQSASELVQQEHQLLMALKSAVAKQTKVIDSVGRRRFRTFLDSVPSLIVHISTDQRVTYCNGRFASFLGLTRNQAVGKQFWEALSADYDLMRPHLLEALKGHEVAFEQSLHGAQERHFHVMISPDFALDDVVHGAFISLLDITERKRLEENQRRSEQRYRALARDRADLLKRAEEAARIKDNFLAMLSHELRTPLTAIVGWAALINSRKLSAERLAEGLAAIERNARSQSRLIEELLDLSRMTSGKMPFELSDVDMGDLVKETVESLRPAFNERRVKIGVEVTDGIPSIRGDHERLQQVVMNLLSNALKFTPEGGHVQVDVNKSPAGGHVQVAVHDTGQGITKDFLPHVFEEFLQADMSSTRKKQGLGLGLAIARRLVELHQGSIRAASPGPGQGATFTVTLPIAPA